GMTTARASGWFSFSRLGGLPTRPPSTGASGFPRSCSRENNRGLPSTLSGFESAAERPMPMNAVYAKPADLTQVIPVFPLPGALLLPRGQMPLNIFEPRYVAMIDDALRSGHRLVGMIQPDPAHPGPESKPNIYRIGCVGRITQIAETGDGRYLLQLTGVARFRLAEELA